MGNGPPLLIHNARSLVMYQAKTAGPLKGSAMKSLPLLNNAWLLIEEGHIRDYGSMAVIPAEILERRDIQHISAEGKFVFPSFCDSHTHLVFAASREQEFVDKIKGSSYEEIAKRGGGILNSAKRLKITSDEDLYLAAMARLNEIAATGTGAVEIKSGYGLTPPEELKILRVIRKLKENSLLQIKATFLGAHAIPLEYINNPDEYVEIVINEMIPLVAAENLADYIDVFCDTGFFSIEQTERILMAGIKYGLRAKLHANQLANSGGVQVGVKYNALSVDHLENIDEDEIDCLLSSETIPTLLPGAAFFLNSSLPPARQMLAAGLPIALASDFNPGSSPSGNMKLILSLACIQLKMLPSEAIVASTINGAFAMGMEDIVGSITKEKIANVFITSEMPSIDYFPYAFGSNLIETVILNGRIIKN